MVVGICSVEDIELSPVVSHVETLEWPHRPQSISMIELLDNALLAPHESDSCAYVQID